MNRMQKADRAAAFGCALFAALTALPRLVDGAAPVDVSVDFNADTRAISPLIFGVSFGDPARDQAIGYTLVRWGGNSVTRYNWQANFYNTASDYFYENIPNCDAAYCVPGVPKADLFLGGVFSAGAEPLVTIPTIGWTARSDSPTTHPFFAGFETTTYGVQTATDYQYDPTAGNGRCDPNANMTGYCVNGLIVNNQPGDTSTAIGPEFEQQWVEHLRTTFGGAANGGVKFYALDNEVMLWDSTHRDVHPDPLTYAGAWTETHDYASAIKQQDADAEVTGPVTWGYGDLWTSAADAASCNCLAGSDRAAHGDLPFVAWYLQQVCANPLAGGARLVDYLDLHYYPQDPDGSPTKIYSDADDATTAARRLASLKELYDPNWTSNSWIGTLDGAAGDDPTWHYTKPDLIPRVHAWIDQYCPGTKLAITEYNWGEDTTASGAVAQAELFGIFARERVDVAARWIAPGADTNVEKAFTLFLDYDGVGSRVRGDSVRASSASPDLIGAYAFRDYAKRNMILLTNKDTSGHSVTITFAQSQSGAWTLYEFDSSRVVGTLSSGTLLPPGSSLTLSALPAMSASLLVLSDRDGVFRTGFGE